MEGKKSKFSLRPVDDSAEEPVPVIRLESKETLERGKAVRLDVEPEQIAVSTRLDVPVQEDYEIRTHQPGLEALIESPATNPDLTEQDWGKAAAHQRQIPWGWFALLGILLAGGAIWSLKQVKEAAGQADNIVVTTKSALEEDAKEDLEAGLLIDRIDAVTRKYFSTTSSETIARHSRHPDRIKPLVERYYGGKPVPTSPMLRTKLLQPLTLDSRANFWMQAVELGNHETRNLIIEILDSGEPKIDWETLVCYQPMKWDSFAKERPTGVSLDFRVYLEQDNFFSHEFGDASNWNCFRLTALDSDETLFGYTKTTDPVSTELLDLLKQNQGHRISVIVRVSIPEGLQSRRGMVIEKLMSQRWIYLDPPEA